MDPRTHVLTGCGVSLELTALPSNHLLKDLIFAWARLFTRYYDEWARRWDPPLHSKSSYREAPQVSAARDLQRWMKTKGWRVACGGSRMPSIHFKRAADAEGQHAELERLTWADGSQYILGVFQEVVHLRARGKSEEGEGEEGLGLIQGFLGFLEWDELEPTVTVQVVCPRFETREVAIAARASEGATENTIFLDRQIYLILRSMGLYRRGSNPSEWKASLTRGPLAVIKKLMPSSGATGFTLSAYGIRLEMKGIPSDDFLHHLLLAWAGLFRYFWDEWVWRWDPTTPYSRGAQPEAPQLLMAYALENFARRKGMRCSWVQPEDDKKRVEARFCTAVARRRLLRARGRWEDKEQELLALLQTTVSLRIRPERKAKPAQRQDSGQGHAIDGLEAAKKPAPEVRADAQAGGAPGRQPVLEAKETAAGQRLGSHQPVIPEVQPARDSAAPSEDASIVTVDLDGAMDEMIEKVYPYPAPRLTLRKIHAFQGVRIAREALVTIKQQVDPGTRCKLSASGILVDLPQLPGDELLTELLLVWLKSAGSVSLQWKKSWEDPRVLRDACTEPPQVIIAKRLEEWVETQGPHSRRVGDAWGLAEAQWKEVEDLRMDDQWGNNQGQAYLKTLFKQKVTVGFPSFDAAEGEGPVEKAAREARNKKRREKLKKREAARRQAAKKAGQIEDEEDETQVREGVAIRILMFRGMSDIADSLL